MTNVSCPNSNPPPHIELYVREPPHVDTRRDVIHHPSQIDKNFKQGEHDGKRH